MVLWQEALLPFRTSHSCTIFTAVPGRIRGYQLFVHRKKSCPSEVIKDSLVKANTPCRSFLGLRNVKKYITAWSVMVLLVFYAIFCYIFILAFMCCLSNGVTKNSCHLFWYLIQLIRYCRSCMFSNSGHFYLVSSIILLRRAGVVPKWKLFNESLPAGKTSVKFSDMCLKCYQWLEHRRLNMSFSSLVLLSDYSNKGLRIWNNEAPCSLATF